LVLKGGEIVSNTENVTTKFKVDISDLKKNVAEANRRIKTYNAEIKNASAGMEKGEESVDSLSKKIEAQSKVVDAEKSKLDLLKQQLEKYNAQLAEGETVIEDLNQKHNEAIEKYGENSEEVKKLSKQLKDAQEAQERNKTAVEKLNVQIINQDTAVKNAEAKVKNYQNSLNSLQNESKQTAAQTETLTEKVKKQESELKALKQRYVNVASEQGKSSDEAKELAKKISDLSSELYENKGKLNDVKEAANKLDKTMEEMSDSEQDTTSKTETLTEKVKRQQSELQELKRKYTNLVAEQGATSTESQDLATQIKKLSGELQTNRKRLAEAEVVANNLDQSLDNMQTEAYESISSIGTLTDRVESQREELKKLKDKYVDVVTQQGATSEEAKDLASKIQNLSGKLKENQTELHQAEQSADNLDQSLEDVGDEANSTTTGGLAAFGVALGNLAANIISAAISKLKNLVTETFNVGIAFDETMSKVKAVSGVTEEELEALREKAGEMGATTKFKASEAAEAMYYMGMAGWKSEQMLSGIDGVMNLAAASGEDLALTSDIVTDALTAMKYSVVDAETGLNNASKFADVLAAASSNANTNVELLGESFKYVAPVAGSMGASMEDLSIALGIMANSGVKGTQAGNSLKNALVNLIKPSKQQKQAMAELGLVASKTVQTYDNDKIEKAQTKVANKTADLEKAQIKVNEAVAKYGENSIQAQEKALDLGKAQNNLAQAQRELASAQKGTTEIVAAGQSAFVDEYDNMKSLREIMNILRSTLSAVNVELIDGDGNLKEYDDLINELSQTEEGLTQAEQLKNAAIIFGKQNLSGMLAIINASEEDYNKLTDAIDNCDGTAKQMADTMLDNLGGDMTMLKSKLESVQRAVFDKFEPALRKGAEVLDKLLNAVMIMVDHSKELSAAIIPLAAAFGVLAVKIAISSIISGVTKAITFLNAAMLANPATLVMMAIAALAASFVYLWKNCESFRKFWINLWEKIKSAAIKAWETISGLFSKIREAITPFLEEAKRLINIALEQIKDMWEAAWGAIKAVWDFVEPFFKAIWEKIKADFSEVKAVLGKFFEAAWEYIKVVWDVASQYFAFVWEKIKIVFSAVEKVLGGFFFAAWDSIKVVWDLATGYFKLIWKNIKLTFNVVEKVFKGDFGGAWQAIKAIWDNVVQYFQQVWNGIKRIFGNVAVFFSSSFNEAWKAVKAVFSSTGEFFGGVWKTIKNSFSSIGTKIGEAIGIAFKLAINAVITTIEDSLNFIPHAVNSTLQKITDITGKEFSLMPTVKLPRLMAKGGIVNRATPIIAGEDGKEAIIPLERNTGGLKQIAALLAAELKPDLLKNSARIIPQSGQNVVNNYSFNQTNNSPQALSRYEIYRQSKNLLQSIKAVNS
jgi:TP901 family phage tail tape measure protein